jgi:hypothetical protein
MNLYDFLANWHEYESDNPKLRKGQRFFNCLFEVNPPLANKLRGQSIDPFHRDEMIRNAIEFVVKNWYQDLDILSEKKDEMEEIRSLVKKNELIRAIKLFRNLKGCDLVTARDSIYRIRDEI